MYGAGMVRDQTEIALRPWAAGDEEPLVAIANNRRIWRNLTDQFPHPYTDADARDWIEVANANPENARNWAVTAEGDVVGCVGFERLADPLGAKTAEIGYWVGEPHWGQGIATAALGKAVRVAFEDYDFVRVQASVFGWNPASGRVLEKAGFELEARHASRIFKDGEICDQLMYARLRAADTAA